ncbi:MAG: DUF4159 domain-containing protein [Sedimentisphaerales bacterium]|nr:DUF4159 domain-containing protein [Sedimentisphaerales bacterium]
MMRIKVILLFFLILCVIVTMTIAQRRGGSFPRGQSFQRGRSFLRGEQQLRSDFQTWEIDPEFKDDVFTFVRIEYDSSGAFSMTEGWDNDYPDADWNFSYRLHQLTSLNVNPESKIIRLTDPELADYPFIYMSGVQRIRLNTPEQTALRKYLLNGGFVMMSDFWNPDGWANMLNQMRGVFPDREPVELKLDHPIFHFVFDLKELPQIPDIHTWMGGQSFEYYHGSSVGDEAPHFWSYFDDKGRMVALICHNNDVGDGWEREGENKDYFHEYAEKHSYPMGINVVMYALTH